MSFKLSELREERFVVMLSLGAGIVCHIVLLVGTVLIDPGPNCTGTPLETPNVFGGDT